MDIKSLTNVSSAAIENAARSAAAGVTGSGSGSGSDLFSSIFASAIDNINTTNNYLSAAENEEIKWALGESENTHDLTVALNKASTALQYTVALRDKFIEAYKEIMQIQI